MIKNMSLDQLIESELAYFAPMSSRAAKCSEEERGAWRAETIRQRQERISLEVYEIAQGKVLYGPFAGMKLNDKRWWGTLDLGTQCLGQYEKEVLAQISDASLRRDKSCFIDIGAADGYYTSGALFSGLFDHAVAFEVAPEGQAAIEANWRENGAPGHLQIFGEATAESLLALPKSLLNGAFVLVDVEGAEFDMLCPDVLSGLDRATIIVEVHNWIAGFEEKYEELLKNAFALFNIEPIAPEARSTHTYSELRDFTDDNRLLLLSERRPCQMRFLKLSPRT